MSFRELISMYDDDELLKPELQRKYVWEKPEASRFIESILLGLPSVNFFIRLGCRDFTNNRAIKHHQNSIRQRQNLIQLDRHQQHRFTHRAWQSLVYG